MDRCHTTNAPSSISSFAMIAAAYARIAGGKGCPGVIIIPQWLPVGPTLEELILIAECSGPEDWVDQVRFLPLK